MYLKIYLFCLLIDRLHTIQMQHKLINTQLVLHLACERRMQYGIQMLNITINRIAK